MKLIYLGRIDSLTESAVSPMILWRLVWQEEKCINPQLCPLACGQCHFKLQHTQKTNALCTLSRFFFTSHAVFLLLVVYARVLNSVQCQWFSNAECHNNNNEALNDETVEFVLSASPGHWLPCWKSSVHQQGSARETLVSSMIHFKPTFVGSSVEGQPK